MTITLPTTLGDLFPDNTVFMPRGSLEAMHWILSNEAYRAETATGVFLAIMGDMPLVCHRNAATPLIQDFFREAGVPPAENLATYATEQEAVAIARAHVQRGAKLAFTYPPPPMPEADAALSIPLSLYHWLNDKANLTELVDAMYVPHSRILPPDSASEIPDFMPGRSVFVKICREGVSGGGSDVHYCREGSSRTDALEWIQTRGAPLTGVRVEEALDISTCWCVNWGIGETGVRYVGAASQLFSAPAQQCGSRIDPAGAPPREVVDIARAIAERARTLGFRGVAGFDVGASPSGRVYVFDLNFRPNACTPQILVHDAAITHTGALISQSWNSTIDGALGPALDRISDFATQSTFLPTRLYEANPGCGEKSMITGIVVGGSLDEIEATESEMQSALGNLLLQASECSQAQTAFSPSNAVDHAGPAFR